MKEARQAVTIRMLPSQKKRIQDFARKQARSFSQQLIFGALEYIELAEMAEAKTAEAQKTPQQ